MSDICAVNRQQAIAITYDGGRIPIVNWMDADGDECEPSDAVTCVAEHGDDFIVIDLTEFEDVFGN